MNAPQNPQNWPQQPQSQPGFGPHQPPPGAGPAGHGHPSPPGQPAGHGQPTGYPGPQQPGPQQPGGQHPGAYAPQPGGQHQGGYAAQPTGPHHGGYGPQPPKKSRTGLVVGIVVGVVVLAVGGVLGAFYLSYTDEPGGGPGAEPIAQCALSADLKSQAHVSSFRLLQEPADDDAGMRHSHCMWGQTKGKDGPDPRTLSFHVYDYAEFSEKEDRNVESAKDGYKGFTAYAAGQQAKPIDGLGDEAMIVIPADAGDLTEVNLLVRKGTVVWNIRYSGHTKGFFTDSAFPVADAEAVALKTAEELISK